MEDVYPGWPPTGVDTSTCRLGMTPPPPSDPRARDEDGDREDARGDKGAGGGPSCPMTSPKTDQSSSSPALEAGDCDVCVNLRMLDATRCNADGRRTGIVIAAVPLPRIKSESVRGEDVVQRRGKLARPDTAVAAAAARAWA